MAIKHLKLAPVSLTEEAWCYEDKRGIQVFIKHEKVGTVVCPVIPWKIVRASLKRKDRKL